METVREISCSISECGRAAEVKGYCKRHYLKWYRYGDPLYGRTNQAVPTDRAFREFEKRIEGELSAIKGQIHEVKEYCEEIDKKLDRELRGLS